MFMEQKDGKDFDFLIGKSIVKVDKYDNIDGDYYSVDKYVLTCSDGTIIEILTNDGCGGCENGWSSFDDLKKLENNNNLITDIETKYSKESYYDDTFTMFIYYEDGEINKLQGDDGYGNGYYGGGFHVTINSGEKL